MLNLQGCPWRVDGQSNKRSSKLLPENPYLGWPLLLRVFG